MRALFFSLAALSALVVSGCERTGPSPGPPDVVLLLVDTLRADHLGLYGYTRPTSPALDRFAASASVFLDVLAPAPWTLPSVGSLMTATYASVHGLQARFGNQTLVSLRPGLGTFAEALRAHGYRTVALVANPWVMGRKHGLRRGFDVYTFEEASAAALNRAARETLADDSDPRPVFLYVHYMDVHGPYDQFGLERRIDLGPIPARYVREIGPKALARIPAYLRRPGTQLEPHIEAYDRGIRGWDEAFGELAAWLAETDRLKRTIVGVVSDHGEEFLEHGGWNHGFTLYQEQVSIPWVLHVPGASARRVRETVSLIDVAPTILALVGAPILPTMVGRNVLGAPPPGSPRLLLTETDVRRGAIADPSKRQIALRRGSMKLVRSAERDVCFDLRMDPREARPITPRDGASDGKVGDCDVSGFALLDAWRSRAAASAQAFGSGDVHEMAPAEREKLRALGYGE